MDPLRFHLTLRPAGRKEPIDLGTFHTFDFGRLAALHHMAAQGALRTARDWTSTTAGEWQFPTTHGAYVLTAERATDESATSPEP